MKYSHISFGGATNPAAGHTSKDMATPPLRTEAARLSVTGRVETKRVVRTQDGVLGNGPKQADQMYAGPRGRLVNHGLVMSTVSPGHRYPSHRGEDGPCQGWDRRASRRASLQSQEVRLKMMAWEACLKTLEPEWRASRWPNLGQPERQDDEIHQRTIHRRSTRIYIVNK